MRGTRRCGDHDLWRIRKLYELSKRTVSPRIEESIGYNSHEKTQHPPRGPKYPSIGACKVSVILVLGKDLMWGYLDPQGLTIACPRAVWMAASIVSPGGSASSNA